MIPSPSTDSLPRAAWFDLDGTLVDTAPDLLAALNHALKGTGRRRIEPAEIRPMIGQGAAMLVRHALEVSDGPPRDIEDIADITERLLRYYRRNLVRESAVYDGTHDVLAYGKDRGMILGVATNKPEGMAVEILDTLGLKPYFSVILGYRGDFLRKPDPAFLERAARLGRVSCARSVMIGDSLYDRVAAELAGMPSLSVGYGYGPLGDHPPDIEDIRQVPQWWAARYPTLVQA